MPTYEYECTSCGQHVEVFQRITEDPLTTCGVCGGSLRKVFHPAGIVFKGSGFYATDNRSKPKTSSSSSSESSDPAKGTGKGSAKEPAKPSTTEKSA
ncbi:MAG TPA: FmdB family zinc ribbon protein [Actinomycetota bacterium]|nr:FmdB family zinc ribbon protein [Actinomycetota bacterium]